MFSSKDLCPHGLLFNECNVCFVALKMKPSITLVEDKTTYEFEPEYPKYKIPMVGNIDKKMYTMAQSIENRVKPLTRPSLVSRDLQSNQKTLFEQQQDLLKGTGNDFGELKDSQQILNIEKKFLKKKEI